MVAPIWALRLQVLLPRGCGCGCSSGCGGSDGNVAGGDGGESWFSHTKRLLLKAFIYCNFHSGISSLPFAYMIGSLKICYYGYVSLVFGSMAWVLCRFLWYLVIWLYIPLVPANYDCMDLSSIGSGSFHY
ncbi:hypothetical protein J3F84DRAFT_117183 [Trichoderma pleuroticola]